MGGWVSCRGLRAQDEAIVGLWSAVDFADGLSRGEAPSAFKDMLRLVAG